MDLEWISHGSHSRRTRRHATAARAGGMRPRQRVAPLRLSVKVQRAGAQPTCSTRPRSRQLSGACASVHGHGHTDVHGGYNSLEASSDVASGGAESQQPRRGPVVVTDRERCAPNSGVGPISQYVHRPPCLAQPVLQWRDREHPFLALPRPQRPPGTLGARRFSRLARTQSRTQRRTRHTP